MIDWGGTSVEDRADFLRHFDASRCEERFDRGGDA
jgi:hypothetical protein